MLGSRKGTLWFVDRLSFKLLREACRGFHSKSFVLEITWDVSLSLHPPARSCICLLLSSCRSFSLHVGLWVRHPRNSMCQPRGYACRRAQRIEHPLPEQAGVRVRDRAALLVYISSATSFRSRGLMYAYRTCVLWSRPIDFGTYKGWSLASELGLLLGSWTGSRDNDAHGQLGLWRMWKVVRSGRSGLGPADPTPNAANGSFWAVSQFFNFG